MKSCLPPFLFALALVAACKRPTSDGAATVHVDAVAPSAAPSPTAKAPPTVSNVLGAAPNLLDIVPARVAVSSTVENPRDFPELLVDGKSHTAWNGRTGDLVGATISFRLPHDAIVKRVEINAGYDRTSRGVDYFTANHQSSHHEHRGLA